MRKIFFEYLRFKLCFVLEEKSLLVYYEVFEFSEFVPDIQIDRGVSQRVHQILINCILHIEIPELQQLY